MRYAKPIAAVTLLGVWAVLGGCGSAYADYGSYYRTDVVVVSGPPVYRPPLLHVHRPRPVVVKPVIVRPRPVVVAPKPVAAKPHPVFVNPRDHGRHDRSFDRNRSHDRSHDRDRDSKARFDRHDRDRNHDHDRDRPRAHDRDKARDRH
jgi:hypothetical protein